MGAHELAEGALVLPLDLGHGDGFAVTSLEKERFLLSSAEHNYTVLYQRDGDAWTLEQDFFPDAGFSRLSGNRLVTSSQYAHPQFPMPVTVWKRAAAGTQKATSVPWAKCVNCRACCTQARDLPCGRVSASSRLTW